MKIITYLFKKITILFRYLAKYIIFVIQKTNITMKKLALLSTLLVAFSVTISSCKSHEKCPAYSKANTTSTTKKSV